MGIVPDLNFYRILQDFNLAERVGFEPTWERKAPHLISSQRRYDRFGTSPDGDRITQAVLY